MQVSTPLAVFWLAAKRSGVRIPLGPLAQVRGDRRVRLDALDPANGRHAPQCEHRHTTNPALLRVILKVQDRDGYWWVECAACQCGWQVAYYAAEQGVTTNPLPCRGATLDCLVSGSAPGGRQAAPKMNTAYLSGSPLARESAPSLTK
jgi:hypothetical protein